MLNDSKCNYCVVERNPHRTGKRNNGMTVKEEEEDDVKTGSRDPVLGHQLHTRLRRDTILRYVQTLLRLLYLCCMMNGWPLFKRYIMGREAELTAGT